MQYPDIGKTWQKLALISGHARRDSDFQFTSLAHLLDVEYLRDCYNSLNRNKAVGIDEVSWEDYGKELDANLTMPHFCDLSRRGNFKVGRKTSRKKFSAKCKDMGAWLKNVRNKFKTKDWWKTLQAKLRGHFQYYGVSENYKGIWRYYWATLRMVHTWLNRRSQKRKMSWVRFTNYLEHYPLPKPKIVHSFYESHAWGA
jgi:hypothetical protein